MKSTNTANQGTNAVPATETVMFGAGCFWCGEAVFQRIPGVTSVKSGYSGGTTKAPTYEQVCTGRSGHAEVVRVSFEPGQISFASLLEVFWSMHDPTTLNRQGADVGTQYRSVIFCSTPAQKEVAVSAKKALAASGKFKDPIVTEITESGEFFPAEACHDDYFNQHRDAPYCRFVIQPKLRKLGMEK